MEGQEEAGWDELPTEVLTHIFSYADPVAVLRSGSVSHHWRDVATSEFVWKARNLKLIYVDLTFGGLQTVCNSCLGGKRPKHKGTCRTWKEYCLRAYRSYHNMVTKGGALVGILNWACTCGHHALLSKLLRFHLSYPLSLSISYFLPPPPHKICPQQIDPQPTE